MKNTNIKRYLPFIGIVALALICTLFFLLFKSNRVTTPGSDVKYNNLNDKIVNIQTLMDHVPEDSKKNIVKLQETGDIYYYSPDGFRYIFPNHDIYSSWFGDYVPAKEETIAQMEKSQLKGAITLKPGSLTTTDSDPKIYLVADHSIIYSLKPDLLLELFGVEWQKRVINLPNWFFAYYTQGGAVEVTGALPDFPSKPTLDNNLISR